MKTGNIILVSNPFYSKRFIDSLLYIVLRWFIGKWHHCAIVWETQEGLLICEARGKGVMASDYNVWLNTWPNRETEIIPIECSAYDIKKHLGKKYDRISFLFYCIIKIITKKWYGRTGEGAQDILYCFEYGALCHHLPTSSGILPAEFISQIKNKLIQQNHENTI